MLTYALDEKNDLFLRNGTISIVETSDETAQDVKTKLKTLQGEVFYDVTYGVPYFSVIFEKPFDKDLADSIIIQTIYLSRNVADISSYQSRIDTLTRRYSIDFIAVYEDQEVQGENESLAITQEFTI